VLTARVDLYRSLGGTWTDTLVQQAGRLGARNEQSSTLNFEP
jgi:hypothetical protein